MLDVIDALGPLSQPELLRTQEQEAELVSRRESPQEVQTGAVVAPVALEISQEVQTGAVVAPVALDPSQQ